MMNDNIVKFKLVGRIQVDPVKDPPLQLKIREQMKQKLGVEFDPDKHAYLHVPAEEVRLGGATAYDIFEKVD